MAMASAVMAALPAALVAMAKAKLGMVTAAAVEAMQQVGADEETIAVAPMAVVVKAHLPMETAVSVAGLLMEVAAQAVSEYRSRSSGTHRQRT